MKKKTCRGCRAWRDKLDGACSLGYSQNNSDTDGCPDEPCPNPRTLSQLCKAPFKNNGEKR